MAENALELPHPKHGNILHLNRYGDELAICISMKDGRAIDPGYNGIAFSLGGQQLQLVQQFMLPQEPTPAVVQAMEDEFYGDLAAKLTPADPQWKEWVNLYRAIRDAL